MNNNPVREYLRTKASRFEQELWAAIHQAVHERQVRDGKETTMDLVEIEFIEYGFPDGVFKWKGETLVRIEEGNVYKESLPIHGCMTAYEHSSQQFLLDHMIERTKAMTDFFATKTPPPERTP